MHVKIAPVEAEDPNFTRPRVPFSCWETNTCGVGTSTTTTGVLAYYESWHCLA